MSEYPVALALEDFVPVALTVTGVYLLSRRYGRLALAAAVLVGAGGLAKATWKLIVALGGPDVQWLNESLFPALATGFTVLLCALYPAARYAFAGALALVLGGALAAGDTWPALIWMIVAVTLIAARLVREAWRASDRAAAALFGAWLTGQYVLGPLAAKAEQSIALQWVEQSCNTAAQAAFAYAAFRLVQQARSEETVSR